MTIGIFSVCGEPHFTTGLSHVLVSAAQGTTPILGDTYGG